VSGHWQDGGGVRDAGRERHGGAAADEVGAENRGRRLSGRAAVGRRGRARARAPALGRQPRRAVFIVVAAAVRAGHRRGRGAERRGTRRVVRDDDGHGHLLLASAAAMLKIAPTGKTIRKLMETSTEPKNAVPVGQCSAGAHADGNLPEEGARWCAHRRRRRATSAAA